MMEEIEEFYEFLGAENKQRFISAFNKARRTKHVDKWLAQFTKEGRHGYITQAFPFYSTREGHDYWVNIQTKWEQFLDDKWRASKHNPNSDKLVSVCDCGAHKTWGLNCPGKSHWKDCPCYKET